jgi:DNA polymerase alpha-associated DNA helicase A
MPSSTASEQFIARLAQLVREEQAAEEKEGALLLTNAPVSLLERNGLALSNLQGSTSVGLGGRTLIELTRSSAYHTSTSFPPHDFRSGDLARLRAQGAAGGGKKGKAASDAKGKSKDAESEGVDAVVYRVNSTAVILAMDADDAEDFVLPERISMCVPLAPSLPPSLC